MADAPPRPARPRDLWPDVAKGMCILLVVLWHVVVKHYQQVDWDVHVPTSAAWGTFGELLLPLRMPLFFTISGVFAAGALARSWPELARTRIVAFAGLYVTWVLIHTAVMWSTPDFDTARARDASALLQQLTITPTNLWYLYALASYFLVARLARRVPTPWLLAGAFVLSAVAAAHLLPVPSNRGQVYQNLFFFLAGLRLRDLVVRHARSTTPRRLALAALAYVGAVVGMTLLGAERWWGVWPLVSVLAVALGVSLAVALCRLRRTSGLLAALGRRTLPVYVMHLPMLALVDHLLDGPLDVLEPHVLPVALVDPLLLTALLVALSLLLHRMLTRCGLGRLFTVPRPLPRPVAAA